MEPSKPSGGLRNGGHSKPPQEQIAAETSAMGSFDGDMVLSERLDVGTLLEAMNKCIEYYHQSDKNEFYGMVAEEYGTILPEFEDVSLRAIEEYESTLRSIAQRNHRDSTVAEATDAEFVPFIPQILAFYDQVGILNGDLLGGRSRSPSPESRARSTGDTDAVDHTRALETGTTVIDNTAVTVQTVTSRNQIARKRDPLNQHQVISMIAQLTQARTEAELQFRRKEELVKAERIRLEETKQQYKRYKVVVKEYRRRDKERKRVQRLMEGDTDDSSTMGELGLSMEEARKAIRKEEKRYKRLQHDITMRYKLLESENERFKMTIEKEMAELRREYSDSYIFPGLLS